MRSIGGGLGGIVSQGMYLNIEKSKLVTSICIVEKNTLSSKSGQEKIPRAQIKSCKVKSKIYSRDLEILVL